MTTRVRSSIYVTSTLGHVLTTSLPRLKQFKNESIHGTLHGKSIIGAFWNHIKAKMLILNKLTTVRHDHQNCTVLITVKWHQL